MRSDYSEPPSVVTDCAGPAADARPGKPAPDPVGTALDVALVVIRNGGSTVLAERTFDNILQGFRKTGVSAAWRLDFVAASDASIPGCPTVVRPVGRVGTNLTRAGEAATLGLKVASGEVGPAAVAAEVRRINALPTPYGRWTLIAAAALAGAGYSQLSGPDWGAVAIVCVAAAVGQFLRVLLQARKLAAAPVTLACGVLSACLAQGGLMLGLSDNAPVVLVSSLMYMVPALMMINGFFDVISQRHLLVGLERIASAGFVFLILALAIALSFGILT
jgi:uncharacterized membrane protein YjjP (DUF1212 family)